VSFVPATVIPAADRPLWHIPAKLLKERFDSMDKHSGAYLTFGHFKGNRSKPETVERMKLATISINSTETSRILVHSSSTQQQNPSQVEDESA